MHTRTFAHSCDTWQYYYHFFTYFSELLKLFDSCARIKSNRQLFRLFWFFRFEWKFFLFVTLLHTCAFKLYFVEEKCWIRLDVGKSTDIKYGSLEFSILCNKNNSRKQMLLTQQYKIFEENRKTSIKFNVITSFFCSLSLCLSCFSFGLTDLWYIACESSGTKAATSRIGKQKWKSSRESNAMWCNEWTV